MPLLPILECPDPRLRTLASTVEAEHIAAPAFQRWLDDMFETMYAAPGIGLAATQVDTHQRFMVIDVTEARDSPLVFINPVIVETSAELRVHQEGCLSIASSPPASSTKSTTSTANYSLTTSPRSSAHAR